MSSLPSQRALWDNCHLNATENDSEPFHGYYRSEFVKHVVKLGCKPSVVELGCGQGSDSLFFAKSGCIVIGLDFSENAIRHATTAAERLGVTVDFVCRDIRLPLPCEDETIEGVFSYLSLHYFDDEITAQIFTEVRRILRADGIFAFCVRSIEDPMFGRGELLGHNIYCNNGHLRHFFSMRDVLDLLGDWNVIDVGQRRVRYLDGGRPAGSVVYAIARKQLRARR